VDNFTGGTTSWLLHTMIAADYRRQLAVICWWPWIYFHGWFYCWRMCLTLNSVWVS